MNFIYTVSRPAQSDAIARDRQYTMDKKTLLYVIDNLGRGGAETLLMGILPELSREYKVIIVTLTDKFEFEPAELVCHESYSLGFSGKLSLLPAIVKLRKIISSTKPDLVHAHLLHSSIVARAACPRHIPLIYSLHTIMSKDAFNNSMFYTWLEKLTLKARHNVIAVSEAALEDYRNTIRSSGRSFVLKNYVADTFLKTRPLIRTRDIRRPLKLLAVGNIKPVKNYAYLLQAFEHLVNQPVTLDIYGSGDNRDIAALQQQIDTSNLAVDLKGVAHNIAGLIPAYDIFVMSSTYEGFGIAPVEAMSMGLPLLLSNIPVFREITSGNALFFDLDDPKQLADIVKQILEGKHDLQKLSAGGIDIARRNYSKAHYLEQLHLIYQEVLATVESDV